MAGSFHAFAAPNRSCKNWSRFIETALPFFRKESNVTPSADLPSARHMRTRKRVSYRPQPAGKSASHSASARPSSTSPGRKRAIALTLVILVILAVPALVVALLIAG